MTKEKATSVLPFRVTSAAAKTPARPTVLPAKGPTRTTSAYSPLAFRSTLMRVQQSYAQPPQKASGVSLRSSPTTSIVPGFGLPAPSASSATQIWGGSGSVQAPVPGAKAIVSSAVEMPPTGQARLASPSASPAASIGPIPNNSRPLVLSDFPRPVGDNGRGMHWVPTLHSSDAVVDRFVREAKEMKIKWMVILNEDAKVGSNDYLVKQLVANGIMPIMRIYTPNGRPIQGDVGAMVRHYRSLGVNYYQLYNEPNLNVENPDGVPNVDKYLDGWIPAAKAVAEAGGLPGLGALAPGGNFDDIEFIKQTFDKIKQRGEVATLDKAWLSMHNYTLNHPLDYARDSNGFQKFKWYDAIVKEKLGRQMPIIGTEGGTHIGSADDRTFSSIDEAKQVDMVTGAYRYMKNREPYNFVYTYWIIANEEGGGADTAFSHQALFKNSGPSPIVNALKNLE